MWVRFFIAFSAFSFLWAVLEADYTQRTEEEWVFRGLEQVVDSMQTLVRDLQNNHGSNSEELNRFVVGVMEKELAVSEMSGILTDYFLAKRLSSEELGLESKLVQLHEMIVLLGVIKQKNDPKLVEKLSSKLKGFRRMIQHVEQRHKPSLKDKAPYKSPRRRNTYQNQFSFLWDNLGLKENKS